MHNKRYIMGRISKHQIRSTSFASYIAHLEEAHEKENLHQAEWWHGTKGGKTGRNVCEFVAIEVDVAAEAYTGGGGDVTENCKHRHAAVLDFYFPKTVKAILVSVLEDAKRVPAAKRGLSTKLRLEGLHHGLRGHGRARRSHEGGGRSHGEREDNRAEHLQ